MIERLSQQIAELAAQERELAAQWREIRDQKAAKVKELVALANGKEIVDGPAKRRETISSRIVALLDSQPDEFFTPKTVAEQLSIKPNSAAAHLSRLFNSGQIGKDAKTTGRYCSIQDFDVADGEAQIEVH